VPAAALLESALPDPAPTEAELLQSGFRYALALTHHREEAEDLVQETWLNLCRRYGRVENRAVLFTSIRNLYIDQCRRRKLVHFDSLDDAEIHEVPEIPVDEPCVKGELAALLGQLKPGEREVIFLHYYQGHTAEEISQLKGQSRGTVLSLIHRTIAKLRKLGESAAGVVAGNQLLLLFVVLISMAFYLIP
jgi:RNA polymerase sigma factor (sigma-70 family)